MIGKPVLAAYRDIPRPEQNIRSFFTKKDPDKGAGMGLSLSHGIIAKMGGTIQARNDNGALFIFCLNPIAGTEENWSLKDAA